MADASEQSVAAADVARLCFAGAAPRRPGVAAAGPDVAAPAAGPDVAAAADRLVDDDLVSGFAMIMSDEFVRRRIVATPSEIHTRASAIMEALRVVHPRVDQFARAVAGLRTVLARRFTKKWTPSCAELLFEGANPLAGREVPVPEDPDDCGGLVRDQTCTRIFQVLISHVHARERHALVGRLQVMASRIESACFDASISRCYASKYTPQRRWDNPGFVEIYSSRCGQVIDNLDPDGSAERRFGGAGRLFGRLIGGDLVPESVGVMSCDEFCAEAGAPDRARVDIRMASRVEQRTSTLYRCPRCKNKESVTRTVQIGAGDEPTSVHCECVQCHMVYTAHM